MAIQWPDVTARRLMRTEVVTVPGNATLVEAVQVLLENRITGMPVTDEGGHLIGVISIRDVLDHISENPGSVVLQPGFYSLGPEDDDEDWNLEGIGLDGDDGATVAEVMTDTVYAVSAEAGIGEIAHTLVDKRIHRVLVTDDDHYVGLVAAMDVMKALSDIAG